MAARSGVARAVHGRAGVPRAAARAAALKTRVAGRHSYEDTASDVMCLFPHGFGSNHSAWENETLPEALLAQRGALPLPPLPARFGCWELCAYPPSASAKNESEAGRRVSGEGAAGESGGASQAQDVAEDPHPSPLTQPEIDWARTQAERCAGPCAAPRRRRPLVARSTLCAPPAALASRLILTGRRPRRLRAGVQRRLRDDAKLPPGRLVWIRNRESPQIEVHLAGQLRIFAPSQPLRIRSGAGEGTDRPAHR